jgi:anthranilate synthase component II
MTVAIIDNYDSFTFNLYQLVGSLCKRVVKVFANDSISFAQLRKLRPSAVIISPGPGHPGNESDFGVSAEIIARIDELSCPLLGVCLGHQGIVHHLGGRVVRAPEIVHGKQSSIVVSGCSPIFQGLSEFAAMRYHSLVAEEASLPDCLQVTARDKVRGLIMAVAHKELPLYGVQFHPESIGSPAGPAIVKNFLGLQK